MKSNQAPKTHPVMLFYILPSPFQDVQHYLGIKSGVHTCQTLPYGGGTDNVNKFVSSMHKVRKTLTLIVTNSWIALQ